MAKQAIACRVSLDMMTTGMKDLATFVESAAPAAKGAAVIAGM